MNQEINEKSSFNVYVDYREIKLIDEFNILNIPVITQNLELGDILIVSTGEFPFTLLFERKAGNDLEASIKDGRYSEQKKRILAIYPPSKCTYIIENCNACDFNESNASAFKLSAVIHTMYRDGIHVKFTTSVSDTAKFIKNVYDRCKAHPEYFVKSTSDNETSSFNEMSSYISTTKIKSKKSDNIDVATCYILQLCQIPGISEVIATRITAVYPTMILLIDALRECQSESTKIKLLKLIEGIAVKKATNLINYLQV